MGLSGAWRGFRPTDLRARGFVLTRNRRGDPSFTLIEMLVIIFIVIVVALNVLTLWIRPKVQRAACQNNHRRLVAAWLAYAGDSKGKLVPNLGGGVPVGTPASKSSWANGWEDFAPNYRDNTNILALTGTPFGRYTGNIRIYKCPADIWRAEQRGIDLPRIRSVSMNAYVGNGTNQDTAPGWRVHRKTSDIVSPSPARLWVFTDEHPDSINDGWLVDDPAVIGSWGDLPGSYHNAGDEIGFADGHAEYHQWMDGYNPTTVTGTVQPVTRFTHEGFGDPLKNDTAWWFARTSAGQK